VLDWANQPLPFKIYTTLEAIPLESQFHGSEMSALDAIAGAHWETTSGVDVGLLARLCYFSNGVTRVLRRAGGHMPFRAAACTGALYHIELYLVCGELPDLQAGVYHYGAHDNALRLLRSGDYRRVLIEASGEQSSIVDAPVIAAFTSTFWRNAWKYQARAYRHVFWDTGTILSNLFAVAVANHVAARLVVGFADEPVNRLLDVDPRREATVCLVALGRGASAPALAPPVVALNLPTQALSRREVDYPGIREAHAASSLASGAEAAQWRSDSVATSSSLTLASETDEVRTSSAPEAAEAGQTQASSASEAPEAGQGGVASDSEAPSAAARHDASAARIPGEGSSAPGVEHVVIAGPGEPSRSPSIERPRLGEPSKSPSIERVILRRGSSRRFSHTPIARSELELLLDVATQPVPADIDLRLTDPYAIVNAVDGMQAGTYVYDRQTRALDVLERGDFRAQAAFLDLGQELAGDAALNVYWLANLQMVIDRLGNRGYRAAQLAAAIEGGKLYLAAYALGLGATGLTFFDDDVVRFFSPHAAGKSVMFLDAVGHPARRGLTAHRV
jgi:SagB-type dehydrogenase family enzyme